MRLNTLITREANLRGAERLPVATTMLPCPREVALRKVHLDSNLPFKFIHVVCKENSGI
jgi:hypothetical protein